MPTKPNIVIVITHETGRHVGPYNPSVNTPNLRQARRVFDLNYAEYQAYREQWADAHIRAQQGRDWLRQAVFQHRRPAAFYACWLPVERDQGVVVQHGFWWSERDMLNAGCLLRPTGREYDALLLALFERGTLDLDDQHKELLDRTHAGFAVLAPEDLQPPGAGRHHSSQRPISSPPARSSCDRPGSPAGP